MKIMEKKLIPAPIDQRNIVSDFLFEVLFDGGEYLESWFVKKDYVFGVIDGIPVMIHDGWNKNNHLKIQMLDNQDADKIIGRFNEWEDDIITKFNVEGDFVCVSFYFEVD